MQNVIVDTDIAIDFLRGQAYANDLMHKLWEKNLAFISILSVYELYAGMKEKETEVTENFISGCNIDLITPETALEGGKLYRHYRKKGITLTTTDCLILATAQIKNQKIATKNTSHYPKKEILFRLK